jgi:hypothetical protein
VGCQPKNIEQIEEEAAKFKTEVRDHTNLLNLVSNMDFEKKHNPNKPDSYQSYQHLIHVRIGCNGKDIVCTALVDSGNTWNNCI